MQDSVIQKISTSKGIGFFTGPISPSGTRAILIAVGGLSALAAIFLVPIALISVDVTWEDFAAGVCVLTAVVPAIIGFRLSRRPAKVVKILDVDGIWISDDIISWGRKSLELEKEFTLLDLYSAQKEPIPLVSEMTLSAKGDTRIDTQESTVTFQITHSRNNKKYYRIVRIHVSQDGKDIYSHNLIVGFVEPILIVDGKLFPLRHMKIADQLRNIADTIKSFKNGGANLSNLLITPRTQISIGIPLAVGAVVGGLVQSLADSTVKDRIINAIAKGEFIDPETGKVLLELIQNYKWNVGFRPLGDRELGSDDNW